VEAGDQLVVTIAVNNYGGIGQLTERFPVGFSFEGSKGDGVDVGGPSSVTVSPSTQTPPPTQTASATRSFSPTEVRPGGTLVVGIAVRNYGGIGQLTETFPDGFSFVSSSPSVTPSGRTLTFNLVSDTSVSYTLKAPTTTGSKSGFTGTLDPATGAKVNVGGPSSVTVSSSTQTPSATRSFSPTEVRPGGTLVVGIAVRNYGGIGQLTETFPDGFSFVESSPSVTPSGRTLTFNLVGDPSVSYTLWWVTPP
jgi:hypothetical protein